MIGTTTAALIAAGIGAGGSVASSALSNRGRQDQQGQQLRPANQELYNSWTNFLGGQVGQGVPGYGGQLSAPFNPFFGQAANNAAPFQGLGGEQAALAQRFMQPPQVGAGQFVREMLPEGGSSAFQNYLSNIPRASMEAGLQFGRGGTGYLEEIARTGIPVNSTDAWQGMIGSQERGIQQRGAQLAERTAGPGGRFGSSYNTAMTDYQAQTAKDQNALIAQMVYGAGENAAGRRLGAATELGRQGLEGMNLGMTGAINAAQIQSQQEARDQARAQLMLQGWGLDISKARTGAEIANMGIPGFNASMGLGAVGQNYDQDTLNRAYTEFIRQQPYANPWNQYIGAAATQFPGQMQQYPQGPSPWAGVAQTGMGLLFSSPWFQGGGNANTAGGGGWSTPGWGTPGGNPATLPQGQIPPWLLAQPTY
jgi:hypothetical protein